MRDLFCFFFCLRTFNSVVAMMIPMLMLARRFHHLFTQAAGRPGMTDGVGFSFPLGAILYEVTIDKKMVKFYVEKGGQQHQLIN